MAGDDEIAFERGPFELRLSPEHGGVITLFRFRNHDLMQPASSRFRTDAREASCFPLVPFSGRLADARFGFQGAAYRLPPNFPPEPHAIHGQGWQSSWEVSHQGEHFAELYLAQLVPGTPLHYEAKQRFTLTDDGLDVELTLVNIGDGPMPAGIGLHPYFIRTAGVTLQARLEHAWLTDERNIPRERVDLPETWDFAQPLRVAELAMDNGFDGWDGRAEIIWPEAAIGLSIEADPVFRHVVIYIPAGADFFCFEPVSNANNGFNLLEQGREDTGVRVLEPEETLTGCVRFRAEAST